MLTVLMVALGCLRGEEPSRRLLAGLQRRMKRVAAGFGRGSDDDERKERKLGFHWPRGGAASVGCVQGKKKMLHSLL